MSEATQYDGLELVPLTDGELELEVSEMEAISLKSLLTANGIEAVMVGASQLPNLPYQIQVPAGNLTDAIRIVQEARQAGEPAAEVAEAAGEAQGDQPPQD